MSRISISGVKSKSKRKLIRDATRYFSEELMGKRLYLDLKVKLVNLMESEGNWGSCELEDDNLIRPREFTILLDKDLEPEEILSTLAHELVHVRQYATGDLYQYQKNDLVRWRKEKLSVENLTYLQYPWEKEAHALQYELTKKFIRSHADPTEVLAFLAH